MVLVPSAAVLCRIKPVPEHENLFDIGHARALRERANSNRSAGAASQVLAEGLVALVSSMQFAPAAICSRFVPQLILALLLGMAPEAAAKEDVAAEFLQALRERGWHDTALEYLDSAETDPLASPEFLNQLDYERAQLQAELAQKSVSTRERQQRLAAAAESFHRFATSTEDAQLRLQALSNAGNLWLDQAVYSLGQAAALPEAAKRQREGLQSAAREVLDRAGPILHELEETSQKELEALPKAAAMQNRPAGQLTRQQLEGKLAESRFLLARLDFEKSLTYETDSSSAKQARAAAARGFAQLYQDYEDKIVGFYGRLYQGRCALADQDFEQALECLDDIVDQPPIANADFRRLVTKAYRYRLECFLASEQFEEAIKEASQWLGESRLEELSQPDWLAVSYLLARAYDAQAALSNGSDAQAHRSEARKLYREVAKHAGEFQQEARVQMLGGEAQIAQAIAVNTFAEALSAGNDALQQMNSAKLAARLAKENNPEAVESLSQQVEPLLALAKSYFQQAIQFADDQTDPGQLASVRYYLCWIHWEEGQLDEAAALGEFVAKQSPDSKYAPAAAKLALAAYERLYNQARQADQPIDEVAAHLVEVAQLLATRWPESPEAEAGLNLLMNMALRDDRLDEAESLLERLPASSRAGGQLRLGGTLWTRYLQLLRDDPESAAALKRRAGQLLTRGYEALADKPRATAAEVSGVLYFAQFLLAEGEATAAITALEDPNHGPLGLIQAGSSLVDNEAVKEEAYKVALRSYLTVDPPQREQAQAMMEALEQAIGGENQQQLINIYVSLGLQLQQQISTLTADGQSAKANAVAEAFQDLLTRVTERAGAAQGWKIQSWIAQTNFQLGEGLSGADADRYFARAEAAYRQLVTQAEADSSFAPSELALLAVKKRLADSLLAQRRFEAAFDHFITVLSEKPTNLELQLATATALQQWGTLDEDASKLEDSIRGAMPQANRKNLVWGWVRLAMIVDQQKRRLQRSAEKDPAIQSRIAKYEDLFFEARLHVIQARFGIAKLASGADQQEQLEKARQSLDTMKRLYPDLGGAKWQRAYQRLEVQMEQL